MKNENTNSYFNVELKKIVEKSKSFEDILIGLENKFNIKDFDYNFLTQDIILNTNLNNSKLINMFLKYLSDHELSKLGLEQDKYINFAFENLEPRLHPDLVNNLSSNILNSETISIQSLGLLQEHDVFLNSKNKDLLLENLFYAREKIVNDDIHLEDKEGALIKINKSIINTIKNSNDYSEEEMADLKEDLSKNDLEYTNIVLKELKKSINNYEKEVIPSLDYDLGGSLIEGINKEKEHFIDVLNEKNKQAEDDYQSAIINGNFISKRFWDKAKPKFLDPILNNKDKTSWVEDPNVSLFGETVYTSIESAGRMIPDQAILNIKTTTFGSKSIHFTTNSSFDEESHTLAAKAAKKNKIKNPFITPPQSAPEADKEKFIMLSAKALLDNGYEIENIKVSKKYKTALEYAYKEYKKEEFSHGGITEEPNNIFEEEQNALQQVPEVPEDVYTDEVNTPENFQRMMDEYAANNPQQEPKIDKKRPGNRRM